MKQHLMQPPSLIAVLMEISSLENDAFSRLLSEIQGQNSFDADRDRVTILAKELKIDIDTLGYIMNGLAYLYRKIHRVDVESGKLRDVIRNLIPTIVREEETPEDEKPNQDQIDLIADRISKLLEKKSNPTNFAKQERLRLGFLPAATGFSSFVDLRPNLSDDLNNVIELIPLIQFRVRTDSNVGLLRNFVFQMDARGLKRLREAVDRAERKLSNVRSNESINHLITKRDF